MYHDLNTTARPHTSRVLGAWLASRDGAMRRAGIEASTPLGDITPGSEMYDVLTGGYTVPGAGVQVNERTAMGVSAVYASVALIGGAIASLPFHLYKRQSIGRERMDSDLWWLFNEQPWPTWTAASAWSWTAQSIGLRGDGFWRIHRVTPWTNTIEGFEPWHPARTTVRREDDRNVYQYAQDDGSLLTLDQDDVLHFPGIGFDGLRSITPLRAALGNSAGIAHAADAFASAFFRNGARPDFALVTDATLKPEQMQQMRAAWADKHQGTFNSHNVAILHGGLKVQQLTMSAEDAQLLPIRRLQVEEIARYFGVPPHMIGYTEKATSWGSGVEQMSIGFVRYTLRRYLDSMAQEINRKVWPKSRLVYGEFLTDALLEGDAKAQAEYFSKALGGPGAQGWMTVNEVRRLKNLPSLPGMDEVLMAGGSADFALADDPTTDEGTDDASNA